MSPSYQHPDYFRIATGIARDAFSLDEAICDDAIRLLSGLPARRVPLTPEAAATVEAVRILRGGK